MSFNATTMSKVIISVAFVLALFMAIAQNAVIKRNSKFENEPVTRNTRVSIPGLPENKTDSVLALNP